MYQLTQGFYEREDVTLIARELIGKLIVTRFADGITSGRIVEIEAYNGIGDKASHAYGGRRTKRTEVMFGAAGNAYVYLCYGIHHLFNVVTNVKNTPHAVLIRAIEPVQGIEVMLLRMKKVKADYTVGKGPGNVARALGISTVHTGQSLLSESVFIADDGMVVPPDALVATTRIGVDYAAEDALLPYRFYIKGNRYVSRPVREANTKISGRQ